MQGSNLRLLACEWGCYLVGGGGAGCYQLHLAHLAWRLSQWRGTVLSHMRTNELRGLWRRGAVWWAVVPLPGGGRVRRSLGTKDLALALEEVRRLRDLSDRGVLAVRADEDGMGSVVKAWQESMRRRGLSSGWINQGGYVVTAALAAMGVETVPALTKDKIQVWMEEEIERKNAHTAATYLRRMVSFCQWLVSSGRARVAATAGVLAPKARPRLRRSFLSREEARRILDSCQDEGLKFALYCALHAGLRKGEIAAARPSWFDLEAGLLHVQNTADFLIKDRDDRTIPLTQEFRTFLKEYGLRSPYMLEPNVKAGKARYRFDFDRRWRAHRKRCGLDDYTFHDMRRTFASLLASSGVSLYKIARWLGDGVAVVEKRYAHLIAQDEDVNRAWSTPAFLPPATNRKARPTPRRQDRPAAAPRRQAR